DMATIEALEVNLRDGEDRLTTEGLPTTQQFLDGGAPDQFPGDVLDVAGFSGSLDSNPVISLPGFADIAQVNFETDTAGLGATTTTISSALPDPTVVGQPYTVTVEVAGRSNAPVGTISVSDGTDSCGPVALIAASALSSGASCDLSSSSAGAKTLTATFSPTVDGFTASSGDAGHLVNAAATSVSVTGPDRLRINTPTAFSANLAVTAPGGGEPAGTVTLSGGGSSCTISLPSATPSCDLSFGSVGAKTITASFVPGNADYLGSSSNGGGDQQSVAFVLSNLEVTKTDNVGTYFPGDLLVYTVQLRNEGPDDAVNLRLLDPVPAGLENVLWTCDSSGGVDCPENSGSGDLDLAISTYPVGALLNFSYYGNVQGSPASITNVASIVLPADATVEDVNLANNSASDLSLAEVLFTDSFENPPAVPELLVGSSNIQAEFESLRIPVEALTPLLDETARPVFQLRDASGAVANVYARLREEQVELALAVRQQDGIWQLSSWQAYASEPLLSWTAQQTTAGWALISVGWED
ncbi:MAG: DUF11 domain-containing protein, partial [Xanthomonadales bacterium]|nr:DUF11 domain-containing protein [Xanthomonadales bacterium]